MSRQRTVIIFKSESESTDLYAEVLRENHFNPIFVPTLSFAFKNLDQLHAKLQTPDRYAGIIFTSPRCVEAVGEALRGADMPSGWHLLHNYAVGEVTHNFALSQLQQLFTHGKQTGNGRNLAEFIVDNYEGSKSLPFLLPCSNLQTDTLLGRLVSEGFPVDACEVYETKCSPTLADNMSRALSNEIEFLAFFSPSGVNCALEYFRTKNIDPNKWKLVAIGPSTRRAMEQHDMKVTCTAARPSVEYLIKVLIDPSECRENIRRDVEEVQS